MRVVARNATGKRPKPPQKLQVEQAAAADLDKIPGARQRAAGHRQQHFRQRVDHFPALSRVLQRRKPIDQRYPGRNRHSRLRNRRQPRIMPAVTRESPQPWHGH